jgi:PAS domain S-box-containing protein
MIQPLSKRLELLACLTATLTRGRGAAQNSAGRILPEPDRNNLKNRGDNRDPSYGFLNQLKIKWQSITQSKKGGYSPEFNIKKEINLFEPIDLTRFKSCGSCFLNPEPGKIAVPGKTGHNRPELIMKRLIGGCAMPQRSQEHPEKKLTETQLRQKTQDLRLSLFEFAAGHTLDELLTKMLDEVESLTHSHIGFYHLLRPDQERLALQVGSTQTKAKFGQALGEGLHHQVSQAGVWADCVHQKKPVIHNDYAALPHKKGLPAGHAEVSRVLAAPVVRDDKVVAILGVGNKATEYTGQDVEIVSYLADVSWEIAEKKRADEALLESKENLRITLNSIGEAVIATDTNGRITRMNPVAEKLTGWTLAEAKDQLLEAVFKIVNAQTGQPAANPVNRALESGRIVGLANHTQLLARNGQTYQIADSAAPIKDEAGNITGVVLVFRDVTETYRMQEAVKQSEEKYRNLFNSIRDAILVADTSRKIIHCNPAFSELFGYEADEIIGRETAYIYQDLAEFQVMGQKIRENMETPNFVFTVSYKKKNGDIFPGETNVFYLRNSRGEIEGFIGMIRDVSERKKAEASLRQSEKNLRLLLEASQTMATDFNIDAILQSVTEKATQAMGLGSGALYLLKDENLCLAATTPPLPPDFPEQLRYAPPGEHPHIQKTLNQQLPLVIEDVASAELTQSEQEVAKTRGLRSILYLPLLSENKAIGVLILGSVKELRSFHQDEIELYLGFAGQAAKTIENARLYESLNQYTAKLEETIKERQQIEESLKESEEKFRTLFQNHSAVKLIIDTDTGRIVEANEAAERFYGWPVAQLQQMRIQDINTLSPEQIQVEMEKARSEQRIHFEFRHRLADGSLRDVEVFSSRIEIKGKTLLHSIIHDITDRRRVEEQLRQAQKMESIGRLAGGVAHDFNNMLSVILGYGEILRQKLHPADPMQREVQRIIDAGNRSSALTRQLLAFSRKQTLQPERLDLNALIRNFERMLRRLIGEDIELKLLLAGDLAGVMADPGQIEQVIMNLAINARDAMPGGGQLIIETANVKLDNVYTRTHADVEPGPYVLLALTDTGAGMDKQTLANLFEPFFTTKAQGKGTGLGLATVYGIVKQSGGHIWVYSESGQGSTFKIYLPQSETQPTTQKHVSAVQAERGGGEYILVVEDEDAVRELIESMLTALGYRVTLAANGGEALLLVEEEGLKPDLVITDVVMPQMSGRVLADRLRRTHPDLKVLFMSGYTDNVIAHHGVLDPGTPFIQKPFSISELGAKVQTLLRMGR